MKVQVNVELNAKETSDVLDAMLKMAADDAGLTDDEYIENIINNDKFIDLFTLEELEDILDF